MGACECFKLTELGGAGHVIKILRAKNGQKLTKLNRYISIITDMDEKWFVVFECTINHLSFDKFAYPNLNTIFLVLHLFSYFFFLFRLPLSTFKPLKRTEFKISAIENIREDFVRQKSGMPG